MLALRRAPMPALRRAPMLALRRAPMPAPRPALNSTKLCTKCGALTRRILGAQASSLLQIRS